MDFKELAFKELEKLVWFLLLLFGFKSPEGDLKPNIFCGGAPPPHTPPKCRPPASGVDEWKSRCNLPPGGGKLHLPRFTINGRSHLMGVPANSGIDEWKSRCNLPPSGGKLHLPRFTINVRSHLMGVPENSGIDEWKNLCNLPPSGGKLHLPRFTINGRYRKFWHR